VPDAGNPQDLNHYSYVRNSPTRYVDPSGHCIPGVNCPGMISGVEAPSGYDFETYPGDEAYVAMLEHLILWTEQEQAETGGMLELAVLQDQYANALAPYINRDSTVLQKMAGETFWMGASETLASFAPNMVSFGADLTGSIAGRTIGRVKSIWRGTDRANIKPPDLRPSRWDRNGISFNMTKEGAMRLSGKENASQFDLDAVTRSGRWRVSEPDEEGHMNVSRALDVASRQLIGSHIYNGTLRLSP
jgi:hypothetical protein